MIEQPGDDESQHDKRFQSWISEIIVNEVINVINDRRDSYNKLDTSKQLMENNIYEYDQTSDTVASEGEINEKNQVATLTQSENICYSSLIDLEVHINSNSFTKSSKHGEGDYQPVLREATAFYQLRDEHNELKNEDASTASLFTNEQSEELIESLQNDIDALSFDDVHLNNSEIDSDAKNSSFNETTSNGNNVGLSLSSFDGGKSDNHDYNIQGSINTSEYCTNELLRHSQKFCQVNDKQYFALDSNLPLSYLKIINENYEQYMSTTNVTGEEQEFLSEGSSQELLIVESENNNGDNSFGGITTDCHNKHEMALDCPLNSPVLSDQQQSTTKINKTLRDVQNWEEKVEVQVNVTEPIQNPRIDSGDMYCTEIAINLYNEEDSMIQSRTYLSSVGVISEHQVARDYLGPTPDNSGFESMKCMKHVGSRYLTSNRHRQEELLVVDHHNGKETCIDRASFSGKSDSDANHLSFGHTQQKSSGKEKKNIISRIPVLFLNIFRKKNKHKSRRAQCVPARPQLISD